MSNNILLYEKPVKFHQKEIIQHGLFNLYGVEIFVYLHNYNDTDFDYLIYTKQKVNKQKLLAIQNFICGIVYATR